MHLSLGCNHIASTGGYTSKAISHSQVLAKHGKESSK